MKQQLTKGFILGLFCSTAFAVNPVPGWYGGLIVAATNTSSFTPDTTYPNTVTIPPLPSLHLPHTIPTSTIDYRAVGGGGGGQIGYRFNDCYRLEAEFLFNSNEYNSISFGDYITIYRYTSSQPNGLNQNGRTDLYTGMFNAYYDFGISNPDAYIIPYVGVGIGYATVQNRISFNAFEQEIGPRIRVDSSAMAAQVIGGFNYFLDDFTAVGIDLRYIGTQSMTGETLLYSYKRNFQYAAFNMLINFAFDKMA